MQGTLNRNPETARHEHSLTLLKHSTAKRKASHTVGRHTEVESSGMETELTAGTHEKRSTSALAAAVLLAIYCCKSMEANCLSVILLSVSSNERGFALALLLVFFLVGLAR